MIQFKITCSPDQNVINTFKFFQNQIYIGQARGNLRINDSKLSKSHVMIEVVEKDLIIHPQKDVSHYLINGKRATQIRKIKAGDIITIGDTVLEMLAFEETVVPGKKEILETKIKILIKENSSRLSVVEELMKLSK